MRSILCGCSIFFLFEMLALESKLLHDELGLQFPGQLRQVQHEHLSCWLLIPRLCFRLGSFYLLLPSFIHVDEISLRWDFPGGRHSEGHKLIIQPLLEEIFQVMLLHQGLDLAQSREGEEGGERELEFEGGGRVGEDVPDNEGGVGIQVRVGQGIDLEGVSLGEVVEVGVIGVDMGAVEVSDEFLHSFISGLMNIIMSSSLILDRYEIVGTVSERQGKSVVVMKNRNSSEFIVGKFQPEQILQHPTVRNVLHEASFLQRMQGYPGIPAMLWSGKTLGGNIVLMVEQLGDTLADRLRGCGGTFTLKTVCMLGISMIQLVHSLHDKGFIHRNIRLKVMQFGRGLKANTLHLNNLLECKNYRDNKTMTYLLKPRLARYDKISIFDSSAAYLGVEKSRRDDMESVILLLVYLVRGSLPWSKNANMNNLSFEEINKGGQFSDASKVCEGLPKSFKDMLEDSRNLSFQEEPNYHWYILKLKALLFKEGQENDGVYDWFSNKKYQNRLRVKQSSPAISLDSSNDFLEAIGEGCFSMIDLNEIEKKHELLFEKMKLVEQNSRQQIDRIKQTGNPDDDEIMSGPSDQAQPQEASPKKPAPHPTNKRSKQKCDLM